MATRRWRRRPPAGWRAPRPRDRPRRRSLCRPRSSSPPRQPRSATVCRSIPPSTWITVARPRSIDLGAVAATVSMHRADEAWPPKPGNTVMHRSRSTSVEPRRDRRRRRLRVQCEPDAEAERAHPARSASAVSPISTWTVQLSAPAFLNASRYSPGFVIIRWQSSRSDVHLDRASRPAGRCVRFGTKWPSMTSTCRTSA